MADLWTFRQMYGVREIRDSCMDRLIITWTHLISLETRWSHQNGNTCVRGSVYARAFSYAIVSRTGFLPFIILKTS